TTRRDQHAPTLRSELRGVGEQIPDDLLEAAWVDRERRKRSDLLDDLDPLCGQGGFHALERAVDGLNNVHAANVESHLARKNAAHVQQIGDELRLRAGIALDDV